MSKEDSFGKIPLTFGKIPLDSGQFNTDPNARKRERAKARRAKKANSTETGPRAGGEPIDLFPHVDREKRNKTTGKGRPAMGTGWGGPARGKGHGGPAGGGLSRAQKQAAAQDFVAKPKVQLSDIGESEALRLVKQRLFELSYYGADNDMATIRASEALANRIEGMPVARNINVAADDISALDDDALIKRREALERGLREGASGTTAPDGEDEPEGMVH